MRSKSRFTTLVLLETRESYLQIRINRSVRFAATVARATQHSLPSERYPLLGPVFHRLDRTSLPGASFDHLVGAGEQRLRGGDARPFCAVVEPGEGHDDAQHKRQLPFEGPPLH